MAVYRIEELPWARIRKLGQSGALFLLSLAPLEDHGSHLPSGVDWYLTDGFARGMAELLTRQRPEQDVVTGPVMPVGVSLLQNLGCLRVGSSTLQRAIHDMGVHLEREGVRFLAILSAHGAVSQDLALRAAARRLTRRGRMEVIAPTGMLIQRFLGGRLRPEIERRLGRTFPAEEWDQLRHDVHAGAWETALMLKYRPDLVADWYRELPPHVPQKLVGLQALKKLQTHRGYFGAPGLATPELGAVLAEVLAEQGVEVLLDFLDGKPLEQPSLPLRVPSRATVVAAGLGLAMLLTMVWMQRKPASEPVPLV